MQSLPTKRVPQSGPPGCVLSLARDRRTGQVRGAKASPPPPLIEAAKPEARLLSPPETVALVVSARLIVPPATSISGVLELVERAADVAPGQLSHRLWDNFVATSCQWPCCGDADASMFVKFRYLRDSGVCC